MSEIIHFNLDSASTTVKYNQMIIPPFIFNGNILTEQLNLPYAESVTLDIFKLNNNKVVKNVIGIELDEFIYLPRFGVHSNSVLDISFYQEGLLLDIIELSTSNTLLFDQSSRYINETTTDTDKYNGYVSDNYIYQFRLELVSYDSQRIKLRPLNKKLIFKNPIITIDKLTFRFKCLSKNGPGISNMTLIFPAGMYPAKPLGAARYSIDESKFNLKDNTPYDITFTHEGALTNSAYFYNLFGNGNVNNLGKFKILSKLPNVSIVQTDIDFFNDVVAENMNINISIVQLRINFGFKLFCAHKYTTNNIVVSV